MSPEPVMVKVKILDKELQIACPENERTALLASAELLNQRMKQLRESGKVIGADRVAIMAALNLTHEMLQQRDERSELGHTLQRRIESMQARVERALSHARQVEM
ncbi:MAG: cell division protein ZapA [Thiotrichales bacterium]